MSKNICMCIAKAETEKEVEKIILDNNMNNQEDWIPLGGYYKNFSIVGGQCSDPEKGIAENTTNMIDAVLLRKCYSLGIDPRGPYAPKSFCEALEMFYGIKDGNCSNMTKEQEKEFLNDLSIIATTKDYMKWKDLSKENRQLNITSIDGGEGQTPRNLSRTILSLPGTAAVDSENEAKSNKEGIEFLQGNLNQGGSGKLNFCKYCLVISKRHPDIPKMFNDENDDTVGYWGWTIIRMEFREGLNNAVFTYYAPNGKIPMFLADSLPLKPKILRGKEAKEYLDYDQSCTAVIPYYEKMVAGTFIKMFNYQLTHKGPLISHFKYDLGKNIYDTGLPINLLDSRKNKFNNDSIFRGMKKFIEDDMAEKEENRLINSLFPIEGTFKVHEQLVKYTVYGFNKRPSGKKGEKSFIDESQAIVFILGQQIQGGLNTRILSDCDLGVVKNSLLTILEFPNITAKFKNDLFMTNREKLRDGDIKNKIISNLKSFYKQDETLKQFCSERIALTAEKFNSNNSQVNEALEKWINNNPKIANILSLGSIVTVRDKVKPQSEKGKQGGGSNQNKSDKKSKTIEEKEDPTFFEPILNKVEGIYTKEIIQNKSFVINFRTDVSRNFLTRQGKRGNIEVFINGIKIEGYSKAMALGRLSIYFQPKHSTKIGNMSIEIVIKCEEVDMQFSYKIDAEVIKNKKESNKDKEGKVGLPEPTLVYLKQGIDGLTEETAVILNISEDKDTYLLNMDNKYLQEKLIELKNEGEREFYKKVYIYAMMFNAISTRSYEENNNSSRGKIEESVAYSTMSMARTFFLTEQLTEEMKKILRN